MLFSEETNALMDMIPAEYIKYVAIILAIAKVADIIVKLTPTKTDDKILKFIQPVMKYLSLPVPDNKGKDK